MYKHISVTVILCVFVSVHFVAPMGSLKVDCVDDTTHGWTEPLF